MINGLIQSQMYNSILKLNENTFISNIMFNQCSHQCLSADLDMRPDFVT